MKRSTFITWDQLKVGLVIMVGLLVLIFAVYRLGQAANLFTKRYELIAFLPSASGLREGGMVSVRQHIQWASREFAFHQLEIVNAHDPRRRRYNLPESCCLRRRSTRCRCHYGNLRSRNRATRCSRVDCGRTSTACQC